MRRSIIVLTAFIAAACGGHIPTDPPGPPAPPPTAVATVTIGFDANNVVAGTTVHAHATARDSAGNVLSGRTVDWDSYYPNIADIDANGLITTFKAGNAMITATIGSIVGSRTISVKP